MSVCRQWLSHEQLKKTIQLTTIDPLTLKVRATLMLAVAKQILTLKMLNWKYFQQRRCTVSNSSCGVDFRFQFKTYLWQYLLKATRSLQTGSSFEVSLTAETPT